MVSNIVPKSQDALTAMVLIVGLLQPGTLVLASTKNSAGGDDAFHERRCEWRPTREYCDWVKTGTKTKPPRR